MLRCFGWCTTPHELHTVEREFEQFFMQERGGFHTVSQQLTASSRRRYRQTVCSGQVYGVAITCPAADTVMNRETCFLPQSCMSAIGNHMQTRLTCVQNRPIKYKARTSKLLVKCQNLKLIVQIVRPFSLSKCPETVCKRAMLLRSITNSTS